MTTTHPDVAVVVREPRGEPPSDATLLFALRRMRGGRYPHPTRFAIVRRETSVYQTSFGSEVVTCRAEDGTSLQLLCKYGHSLDGHPHGSHGHRGGLPRESYVYRHVLPSLNASTPQFEGYDDVDAARLLLAIEFLGSATRLTAFAVDGYQRAADWIGRFHRDAATLADASTLDLPRYDESYYLGWVERTLEHAKGLLGRYPWLPSLCAEGQRLVEPLLNAPGTVVHGEYYPKNVLCQGGRIAPVDWESAAVAAGELDLATLTSGWPEQDADAIAAAYVHGRWPSGAPDGHQAAFAAARTYTAFRELGDDPKTAALPASESVFAVLEADARRIGVL